LAKKEEIDISEGQFVYYPAFFPHTFIATSEEPVHCLAILWKTNLKNQRPGLDYGIYSIPEDMDNPKNKKFLREVLFENTTSYLKKLHCHASIIKPGGEVRTHRDIYDVVSIILEGEVETIGKKASPYDVIFYATGRRHGLLNSGGVKAREIVFEFHTNKVRLLYRILYLVNYYTRRYLNLKFLKKKTKKILKRILPGFMIWILKKIYHFLKVIKNIPGKIAASMFIDYFRCSFFVRRQYRNKSLFTNIEIETINRCNGVCPFCPVNSHEKQRPYAKMTQTLFHKIIDELKTLDYKGSISLYSNNEPFLDKRIIKFYAHTRRNLPEAYVFIYTNGTLLTLEKFLRILPCVDRIVINNYSDDIKMPPNIAEIDKYCREHPELSRKVRILMIPLNQVRTSRGGQAPNKGKQKPSRRRCTLPFRQIIVRPDGKISLCSNDALGVYTMGDVNKQTLREIWTNDYFQEIRKEMVRNGRRNLKLCQDCDNVVVSKILAQHSG